MREFIIADENRNDIGYLSENCSIDIDAGKDNSFQLIIPLGDYNPEIYKVGNIFYSLGSEYGGILNNPKVDTKAGTITFTGDTPRGMLSKKIVEPGAGQAYRIYYGRIGNAASNLIETYSFGNLIKPIPNTSTSSTTIKWDRYTTVLNGLIKELLNVGYKLEIKAEYDDEEKIVWNIYTVPITDYSEQIEFSQDGNIQFVIQKNTLKYNHMICAGKGELANRMIVHLYLDSGGNITTSKVFNGLEEVVYFYDYSSVESEEELIKAGKEKFKEINPDDTQEMTVDDMDLMIGDIVSGREYVTGITLIEKVTQKIYKCNYGVESIEYKIGSDK